MPEEKVEPYNQAPVRPKRGVMTWVGLIAIIAFAIILALVLLRPAVDRQDGAEPETSAVNAGIETRASE